MLPRSGLRAPGLRQRLSTLAHGQLGTCALCLVPIGPDQHGMYYEAVCA